MYSSKLRWFYLVLMGCVLATISSPVSAAEKDSSGEKVAVVNGSVVTQSAFEAELNRVLERFRSSGRTPTGAELTKVRAGVLENLIARELLSQESQKEGIKIDQSVIDEELKKLKGKFPSEAEFATAMSTLKLTEESLKTQIGRDLAIKQLIDRQVVENITVTEEEKKAYYDAHPDFFQQPEQVRASHILIKVEADAGEKDKAEAKKKIEMVQEKIKKGEDFGALAKEFSEGPSNSQNGDLGFFGRGQMVKPFEETAFSLKPGEVSEVVETQFGYHIIKVSEKTPESTVPYEEVKDRLGQYLKQEKIQEKMQSYVKGLEEKGKVERLLKVG